MAADQLISAILSWASEKSHRGALARAFRDNLGNDARLQSKRLAMLGIYAEEQAKRKNGLALA
jgi:hypothetical protein